MLRRPRSGKFETSFVNMAFSGIDYDDGDIDGDGVGDGDLEEKKIC